MRRGPPVLGVHRAGTFALFLLPGGCPRCFVLEPDPAAAEKAEGSIAWGSVAGEVALKEEGEVPEVSRRLHLKGTVGIEASNLSAAIRALAQRSTAK
jgi:hypothetical protein